MVLYITTPEGTLSLGVDIAEVLKLTLHETKVKLLPRRIICWCFLNCERQINARISWSN